MCVCVFFVLLSFWFHDLILFSCVILHCSLIEKVAKQIWEVEDKQVRVFPGSIREYKQKLKEHVMAEGAKFRAQQRRLMKDE